MALNKITSHKGYDYEYWTVMSHSYDKLQDRTSGKLGLFKDEETRKLSLQNEIAEKAVWFNFDGDLAVKDIYALLVKSDIEQAIVEPAQAAVPEVLDANGKVVRESLPAVPAKTEKRENNFFADAKSI